jgi:hypothetical protein
MQEDGGDISENNFFFLFIGMVFMLEDDFPLYIFLSDFPDVRGT